jgi:tetratricopeptide (TPR) repeat protein
MEYLGNLPESKPEVRVPFELGKAAMDAYKWDEAIGHFNKATKHAEGPQLVALHGLLGRCHSTPGRWREALKSHEESARLAEQYGDKQGWAAALDNIGVIWRNRGEYDKAKEKHEAALKLAREAGARPQEASALGNIGVFHENDRELKYYGDALKIHEQTGDRRGQAATLGRIGGAWLQKNELDKALEYHEQALAMAREVGARREEAAFLCNIGVIREKRGEPDKVLEYGEEALRLFREVGDKEGESFVLATIGSKMLDKGEHEKAAGLYLAGLEISTALDLAELSGPARPMWGLGKCLDAMGRDRFVAACVKAGKPEADAEKLAGELASPEEAARRH